MSSTLEHDPRVVAEPTGWRGVLAEYRRRLWSGDIGQLPVLISLVVIAGIFQIASHGTFLASENLVNLLFQMAPGGTIAIGVVLVLLLGEVDLSAGAVSGLAGAIMAVLSVRGEVSAPVALGVALLAGVLIGAFQGIWTVQFGIPSFVVTLAGLSAWSGAMLLVLGETGTVYLRSPVLVGLSSRFVSGTPAYMCTAAFIAYVALGPLVTYRARKLAELSVPPLAFVVIRAVAITAAAIIAVIVLDADRGISSGLLFLVGAVVIMDFVLRRMRFGRMVYATGGNAEAARRAGIPVRRVRITVFALASLFAALGGMLAASRVQSANQSAGGGPVLLNAIASAVIGGISLFGGRGSMWAALLGTLVIQSISNGMDLFSLSPGIKSMVTGGVLLVTVTVDAVLRRSRQATAR